jgi:hypothetical protein
LIDDDDDDFDEYYESEKDKEAKKSLVSLMVSWLNLSVVKLSVDFLSAWII